MTLSYNVGLTGGALAAYMLEKFLGPTKLRPCTIISVKIENTEDVNLNYTTKSISRITTAISTTAALHITRELTTPFAASTSLLTMFSNATNIYNTTLNNEVH